MILTTKKNEMLRVGSEFVKSFIHWIIDLLSQNEKKKKKKKKKKEDEYLYFCICFK